MSLPAVPPAFAADPAALSKISYAPVPDWVQPVDFDASYPRKDTLPLTCLLIEEQQHAEKRCLHSRQVSRLENMQAVQQLSQWRTSFDPLTQSLILHHLRVHRDGAVFDYAKPENVRILQREENLDAFILHGHVTVLVVLDDVRPGDIIETAYSILHTPRLLPHRHSTFYTLPESVTIAKHHLSLLFASSRDMKWKTATPGLAPEIETLDDLTRWTWRGADRVAVEPETNIPGWELPGYWVQASDVQDWVEVSQAAATAWAEGDNGELLDARIEEIRAQTPDLPSRVEHTLRFIQDEFRYLSVNLELGGHIPAPPASVLRRRYGDCKDLSFLTACLLRKLGVEARPVLVHTTLAQTVETLLPGVNLFNHAIVELTLNGETRWIDVTLHRQGGGPLGRSIPPFGVGLPVASPGVSLVAQPAPVREVDCYEVHETLLLDTAGKPSVLRVTIRATGRHAEGFRWQLEAEGLESFTQSRAKWHSSRYAHAAHAEALRVEDDRESNEWRLVEVLYVDGFTVRNPGGRRCEFVVPQNLAASALPLPEKQQRRHAFAVPDALHIEHTIEVKSRAFHQQPATVKVLKQPGVFFKVEGKHQAGRWSRRAVLDTSIAMLPPQEIEAFRKLVESIWNAAAWSLAVPTGIPRQHRGPDFASLPAASYKRGTSSPTSSPPAAPVSSADVAPASDTAPAFPQTSSTSFSPEPGTSTATPPPMQLPAPATGSTAGGGTSRGGKRRRRSRKSKAPLIAGVVVVVLALLAIGAAIYFFA